MWTTVAILLFMTTLSFEIVQSRNVENALYCESYQSSTCNSENKDKCTKQEKCGPVAPEKRYHCFTLWEFNVNKNISNVQMKGCFLNNKDCYKNSHCIQKNKDVINQLFFCCCNENMCNQNFTYPSYLSLPQKLPSVKIKSYTITKDEAITLIIAGGMLLFIIMLVCVAWYFYKCAKTHDDDAKQGYESPSAILQKFHSDVQKEQNRLDNSSDAIASIKLMKEKAYGRFGSVWIAHRGNEVLAVKVFPLCNHDSWQSELKVFRLAFLEHDNVLRFIAAGRCGDGLDTEFWLVTPYYERGSLYDFLRENVVTWSELCDIVICITKGLNHLHQEIGLPGETVYKPAIAHRDFKSKNVLLRANMHACVADFGLALIFEPGLQGAPECGGDQHYRAGTPRYMAPEIIEGIVEFRKQAFLAADVYAYALLLWELVSRCYDNPDLNIMYQLPFEKELGSHPTMNDLCQYVVKENGRPFIPYTWKEHPGLLSICDIIEDCWDQDVDARLSSSCVLDRLEILKNEYMYIMNQSEKSSFKCTSL